MKHFKKFLSFNLGLIQIIPKNIAPFQHISRIGKNDQRILEKYTLLHRYTHLCVQLLTYTRNFLGEECETPLLGTLTIQESFIIEIVLLKNLLGFLFVIASIKLITFHMVATMVRAICVIFPGLTTAYAKCSAASASYIITTHSQLRWCLTGRTESGISHDVFHISIIFSYNVIPVFHLLTQRRFMHEKPTLKTKLCPTTGALHIACG